jgi:hypothetical protein
MESLETLGESTQDFTNYYYVVRAFYSSAVSWMYHVPFLQFWI